MISVPMTWHDKNARPGEWIARLAIACLILPALLMSSCAAPIEPTPKPMLVPTLTAHAYAQTALTRAEQLHAAGNLDAALAEYNHAVEFDPNWAIAYTERGSLYLILDQREAARVDLDRALALDPHQAQAYFQRGTLNFKQKQFSRAIDDYSQVIELDPQSARAYLGRGEAQHQTGFLSQALLDYDAAIARDPQLARAFFLRGEIERGQLAFEPAFADLSRAIELDPHLTNAYVGRGILYARRDQFIQAIADYTHALESDDKLLEAYTQRAAAYAALGQHDLQIADLSKVLELSPQDIAAYKQRAAAYKSLQKFDLALADYSRAIQLDPKSPVHYTDRARTYREAGKFTEAIGDYSAIITLDSKNAEALYQRGQLYGIQNERTRALSDFTSAIRLNARYVTQPLLDPLDTQFHFGDNIANDHRQTIRNFVLLTQHYLNSQFEAQVVSFTTTKALAQNDPWLNARQLEEMDQGKVAALAGHKQIAVLISDRYLNARLESRFGILAHEYYHLWQDYQSGVTGVPNSRAVPRQGPLWLIEGCAEYVEGHVLEFYGMNASTAMPYVPLTAPLQAMESRTGTDETFESGQYYLGYYACEYLEKKAGQDTIVRSYWQAIGKGGSWQDNFKTVFGISRESFYAEFENLRKLTPTPTRPPTRTPTRTATPIATPRP